jgi:replicative DNA helicase
MNIVTQADASRKSFDRFDVNLKRPVGLFGCDSGHHLFNLVHGGHSPTKILTYAQRSGGGKSTTLINMAAAAGRVVNGRRAELLIGSWEMEASFLIDRYISYETGIPIMKLRYPRSLSQDQRKAIHVAYTKASQFPVSYHQNSTDIYKLLPILDEFIKSCEKKSKMEGLEIQPVFALDFIGRIRGASKYSNKTYDIENFLQEIKQYANLTGLSVYILAQILRSADDKEYPDLADIKDSSTIEDNSDTVIIGHSPSYYGKDLMNDPDTGMEIPSAGKMLWRVVKAREARPRDEIVMADMSAFRIWPRDMEWDTPYWENYTKESFWENLKQ